MARIVEVPVVDNILHTLLSIFQKFLRVSTLFIFFAQIHEEVAKNGLAKSVAHLVKLLKSGIYPLYTIRPVPDHFVSVVSFPVIQTGLAVFVEFFFRQVGFQKRVIGRANCSQLIKCIPIIIIHALLAFIAKRSVAIPCRSIVIYIFVGKFGMP